MNDAASISIDMPLVSAVLTALAAFAAIVGAASGVVFLLLRAKLDDIYMTRKDFVLWVENNDRVNQAIVQRLEATAEAANATAERIGKAAAEALAGIREEVGQVRGMLFELLKGK